jgi:hypothetical protein
MTGSSSSSSSYGNSSDSMSKFRVSSIRDLGTTCSSK